MPTEPIISRPLTTEQDWWRVHRLLQETFPITGPGFNWELRHWEGNRYHRPNTNWHTNLFPNHQLWETESGRLVGMLHQDGNEICLQVHPDYRTQIEEPMLAYGEQHFTVPDKDGRPHTHVMTYEYDAPRWRMLARRGYEKLPAGWITRWMRLGQQPLPLPAVTPGYTLRPTYLPAVDEAEHWADCQRMADLLNQAFNRPGFHQALEYHNFMTQMPMYLNELNLVMVAPDGSFAAHAALNFDAANRYAVFEPVCTAPDHRQKGLAKALMLTGLQRVRQLGVRIVEVSTGDMDAANALYDSIGFTEYYKAYYWKKVW